MPKKMLQERTNIGRFHTSMSFFTLQSKRCFCCCSAFVWPRQKEVLSVILPWPHSSTLKPTFAIVRPQPRIAGGNPSSSLEINSNLWAIGPLHQQPAVLAINKRNNVCLHHRSTHAPHTKANWREHGFGPFPIARKLR